MKWRPTPARKDPFEPFFKVEPDPLDETPKAAEDDPNKPVPHAVRGKQELEEYALDSLRMLGSFEIGETIFGIVRDPGRHHSSRKRGRLFGPQLRSNRTDF